MIGSTISHNGAVTDLTLVKIACSICPILSGPARRTARKQKGKSRTLRERYTPNATQPYSLDNFCNRALIPVGSGLPRFGVGSGRGPFFDELERKLRKGRRRRSRYVVCHDRRGFNLAVRAVKYDREKAFVLRVGGVCLVRVRLVAAWKMES
jgi:hypothetical protein